MSNCVTAEGFGRIPKNCRNVSFHDFSLSADEILVKMSRQVSWKSLALNSCYIKEETFKEIAKSGGDTFESLYLYQWSNLSDEMLCHLCYTPNITYLHLHSTIVTDAGGASIAQFCTSLQKLSLDTRLLSSECIGSIIRANTSLQHLSITGIKKNEEVIFSSLPPSMISITCNNCCRHDSCLKLISKRCPALQLLDLNQTEITDYGLQYLTKMNELLILRIQMCTTITDIGMMYLVTGSKSLRHLNAIGMESRKSFQEFTCGTRQLNVKISSQLADIPKPWKDLFAIPWE